MAHDEPSEEQQLVAASKKGDLESFNRLVEHYQGRIYTICYRMLSEAEAAADASQDTFLTAFRKLHTFRGGSFRSWLMRIATNTCYDILRARKRRPTTSLDAALPGSDDESRGSFEPPDHSESPDDFVMRRELGAAIQNALAELPDDQRLVIILSDVQGYSYQEIADIVGANLGTIKSRLSRGRARLRDILKARELLPSPYRQSE